MNARQAKKQRNQGTQVKGRSVKSLLREKLALTQVLLEQVAEREREMGQRAYRSDQAASAWRDKYHRLEQRMNRQVEDAMKYARRPFQAIPSVSEIVKMAPTLRIDGQIHMAVSIDFGGLRLRDLGEDLPAFKEDLVRAFAQKAQEHAREVIQVIRE